MSSGKKPLQQKHQYDSGHLLQQAFHTCIQSIREASTRKKAQADFKELVRQHSHSPTQINLIISLLSKSFDSSHTNSTRTEIIKLGGILAETLKSKLIEFAPKLIQINLHCLASSNADSHEALQDSFSKIAKHVFCSVPPEEAKDKVLKTVNSLLELCEGTSRHTQIGSAACLSKVFYAIPGEIILNTSMESVLRTLATMLGKLDCENTYQLMECVLGLFVSIDENRMQLGGVMNLVLDAIMKRLSNPDWNIRNLALEILYLLSQIAKEDLEPYKNILVAEVSQCRTDKIKDVRDMAVKTLGALKKLNDSSKREESRGWKHEEEGKKEIERKRPGILKDTLVVNNYITESTPDLRTVGRLKEKIGLPMSTKHEYQSGLSSDSPFIKFYSPNSMSQSQFSFGRQQKLDDSEIQVKLVQSGYLKRPEKTFTEKEKEPSRKSLHPNLMERSLATTSHQQLVSHSKDDFEEEEERVSKRRSEKEERKANNGSMQSEEIQPELMEVIKQLKKIHQKQDQTMEKVLAFQASTQEELSSLNSRMTQLETIVKKLSVQQKEITSSVYSSGIKNTSYLAPFQPQSRTSERYAENGRDTASSKDFGFPEKAGSPIHNNFLEHQKSAKAISKVVSFEDNKQGLRTQNHKKEGDAIKGSEIKMKKPLLWSRIDDALKKQNYVDAYDRCLEEQEEETLLYLMKQTGPVHEKLGTELCESVLNKVKAKLFEEEDRKVLLEWIERGLFLKLSFSKGTLTGFQGILKQILDYHTELRDRERVKKVHEYLTFVLEKMRSSGVMLSKN